MTPAKRRLRTSRTLLRKKMMLSRPTLPTLRTLPSLRMMPARLTLPLLMPELMLKLLQENAYLKSLSGKTLGVYFNAYRSKAYDGGGEENLTFNGTYCNVGGGLDIDTGIFTCPTGGTYLFMFHIATHDNKKALLSTGGTVRRLPPSLTRTTRTTTRTPGWTEHHPRCEERRRDCCVCLHWHLAG